MWIVEAQKGIVSTSPTRENRSLPHHFFAYPQIPGKSDVVPIDRISDTSTHS